MILARSSVETCILGLYCLHEDGAVAHLQAANIKGMRDVVHCLSDTGLVQAEVIEQCVAALGESRPAPKVWDMAKRVEQATGHRGAISLYQRFYVPTSNFFVPPTPGTGCATSTRATSSPAGPAGRGLGAHPHASQTPAQASSPLQSPSAPVNPRRASRATPTSTSTTH